MELQTGLSHLHSEAEFNAAIEQYENVMICCGRMGPMCVPVYSAMEILRESYPDVHFFDMPFDHPEAHVIRRLPECQGFMGLPFTVYFKKGSVARATTSIQTKEQIEAILQTIFK
jgi:thioredoxin 1